MKLFKHEHKEAELAPEPVLDPVDPEGEPEVAEVMETAAEPAEAPMPDDDGHDDGVLVITVPIAGLDPEHDVEVTVSDGLLHVRAQHRDETTTDEDGYVRQEVRYASFQRTVPLPAGVSEADIEASCTDGILEVRVPAGTALSMPPEPTKIPITTT